jgi:hypothetical protein
MEDEKNREAGAGEGSRERRKDEVLDLASGAYLYCNVHNYGFGLGRHYTVVRRAIHPHNHENAQTAKRELKSPYFIVIVPFSTVKVSTLYLIFLTFSRFCT